MSGFVFSEKPLSIDRGDGLTLIDTNGNEYLDFGASYACTPVGHCHERVVEAIGEQAGELLYVQGSYPVAARSDLHDRLATLSPDGLENVWLCNSGTEANEAALKFARSATDRSKIVAANGAFHGRTMGALSTTWKPKYKLPYEPLLADVEFVEYGNSDALAEAVDDDTAAVILEPIQGEAGINEAPRGFFETAREETEAVGAALIFDEIQTGLGRTGTFWACESFGVVPDILTSAKGLASGLPMGATICADWIADGAGSHGSTFSGNPLVCAAANATLDVIVEEDLTSAANDLGSTLRTRIETLAESDDGPIGDVRGRGLMIGIDVPNANRALRNLAIDQGILALPAGRRTLRFLPPLILEPAHIDALESALSAVFTTQTSP